MACFWGSTARTRRTPGPPAQAVREVCASLLCLDQKPVHNVDNRCMPWSWVTGKQKSFKHRAAERHDTSNLRVPQLGDLIDLSVTGMRLKCEGKPNVDVKQVLPLVICNDGQCVKVMAQVVWVRRIAMGGKEHQIGLRFLDLRPGIQKALDQFARFGCITGAAASLTTSPPAAAAANTPPTSAASTASTTAAQAPAADAPASSSPGGKPGVPATITVDVEDIYQHLGLSLGATDDEIRKAYHEMAMKYHPDRCKEAGAEEKFRLISKTYLILKDPAKRAKYDQMLRREVA